MDGKSAKSQREAHEHLIRAAAAGRTIVPLLGAGISAEVGFPPLGLLTEYLAKVQGYLHRDLFRFPEKEELEDFGFALEGEDGAFRSSLLLRTSLRERLYRVGWPDPNQLHADLWHYLTDYPEASGVRYGRRLEWLYTSELLRGLGAKDEKLAKLLWKGIRGSFRPGGRGAAPEASPGDGEPGAAWRPTGVYWRDLLETLTRSDRDLVDSLFQVLTSRRRPGLSHRYLALLVPVLRLRLFFTINFDPFLEQALQIEGLSPEVFHVSESEGLPHHSLVREQLAVVKLHGSGHGLRVGDSLNAPIDRETEGRFLEYLPRRCILLVMGIGGWDERILDLLAQAYDDREAEVVWLHFERDAPLPVRDRFERLERERRERERQPAGSSRFLPHRVRHPGAFLQELYVRYKGGLPTSRTRYRPHPPRPVPANPERVSEGDAGRAAAGSPPSLWVCQGRPGALGFEPAVQLAELVAGLAATHQPIWIDLDTLSTVSELLDDLVTQLRTFDPALPPYILSEGGGAADGDKKAYEKAIRRVVAALGRGRYVVAFNGVDAFGRGPFEHHRNPREEAVAGRDAEGRGGFHWFLPELVKRAFEEPPSPSGNLVLQGKAFRLRDSVLAFCIHSPGREDWPSVWTEMVQGVRDPITETEGSWLGSCPLRRPYELPDVADLGASKLAELACFRRWRSLAYLARRRDGTASDPGDPREEIPAQEGRLEEELLGLGAGLSDRVLLDVEGGFLWMSRPFRDWLFDRLRRGVKEDTAQEKARLERLIEVQRGIAQHYLRDLYAASGDVGALREHVYHRVELLRLHQDLYKHLRNSKVRQGALDKEAEEWRREYRALVGVVEQEQTWLLLRTPGTGLARWAVELDGELGRLVPSKEDGVEAVVLEEFRHWEREGRRILGSLLIELYQDALQVDRLLRQLYERQGHLAAPGRRAGGKSDWAQPGDEPWKRPEDWIEAAPAAQEDGPRELLDRLLQAADGLRRVFRVEEARRVSARIAALVKGWRSTLEEASGDEAPREPGTGSGGLPPRATLAREEQQRAEARSLRLQADLALMAADPWHDRWAASDSADESDGAHPWTSTASARNAEAARGAIDRALELINYLPEDDYVERGYLYSLRGRAFTLLGKPPAAYRAFELARAVLSRRSASWYPSEALVANCLRNAECLILHAGREGDEGGHIATREARLAQAADLLNQAEGLLEQGRRSADWWACLFQLRAQLQVQRVFTMIREPREGEGVERDAAAKDRGKQEAAAESQRGGASWGSGEASRWRDRIARATRAVRSGLDAIRRGLDVVAPEDENRRKRFVRLWLELLVAAVHVRAQLRQENPRAGREASEETEDGGSLGSPERTLSLWVEVNYQAGLERLPMAEDYREKVLEAAIGDAGTFASAVSHLRRLLRSDLTDRLLTAVTD